MKDYKIKVKENVIIAESRKKISVESLMSIMAFAENGFTVSLYVDSKGNFPSPEKGYAVSIFKDYELNIRHDDIGVKNKLINFLHNSPETAYDLHVGGWFNREDGFYYLDYSIVLLNRKLALATAKENNQLAIYSLHDKKEIRT